MTIVQCDSLYIQFLDPFINRYVWDKFSMNDLNICECYVSNKLLLI